LHSKVTISTTAFALSEELRTTDNVIILVVTVGTSDDTFPLSITDAQLYALLAS
jgi:hypothetical protein